VGPALTAASFCDVLGVDAMTLRHLVATDHVLELITTRGDPVYLRAQLDADGSPAPGLPDVIAELATGVEDPWTWATWLMARTSARRGRNAFEQLHAGHVDEVVCEACRTAWAWRA
jgi:hypothetical protein